MSDVTVYKIRCSQADTFQKYFDNDISQYELIDELNKMTERTFQKDFGTFIHKYLLEDKFEPEQLKEYGYSIRRNSRLLKDVKSQFESSLGADIFAGLIEQKESTIIDFGDFMVELSGTIDLYIGFYGLDIKNVSGHYSWYHNSTHQQFYECSMQGYLYCLLFGLKEFRYLIFCFDKDRTELLITEQAVIFFSDKQKESFLQRIYDYGLFIHTHREKLDAYLQR